MAPITQYKYGLSLAVLVIICAIATVTAGSDSDGSGVATPCVSNPCQNAGTCTSDTDGSLYTCGCVKGFKGTNCEINIDDCVQPTTCTGNEVCIDQVNGYRCARCPAGFTGSDCKADINECSSYPCQNGLCVDLVNGYRCDCDSGYEGVTCQKAIKFCQLGACHNNATCIDHIAKVTCICAPGFRGDYCDVNINECQSNSCLNGGTCHDAVNDFTCSCPAGFTGKSCQQVVVATEVVDACRPNPCGEGATCTTTNGQFHCACAEGFTGTTCKTANPTQEVETESQTEVEEPQNNAEASGLSAGTVAGIAVPIVVVFAVCGVLFVAMRKGKLPELKDSIYQSRLSTTGLLRKGRSGSNSRLAAADLPASSVCHNTMEDVEAMAVRNTAAFDDAGCHVTVQTGYGTVATGNNANDTYTCVADAKSAYQTTPYGHNYTSTVDESSASNVAEATYDCADDSRL